MFKSIPNNFMLPVSFVDEKELGFTDYRDYDSYRSDQLADNNMYMSTNPYMNGNQNIYGNQSMSGNLSMDNDQLMNNSTNINNSTTVNMDMEAIKNSIGQLLNASFPSVFKDLSRLSKDQMLKLVLEVFEELMELHVENVPCLKKVENQGFNGMTYDQIVNMHLDTVRRYFNFHFNGFGCAKYVQTGVNNMEFEAIEDNLQTTVENAFRTIYNLARGLSAKEIENVHIAIFTKLFYLLLEYVPCFSGIDSQTAMTKLNDHLTTFINIYRQHITMLGCS